MASKPSLMDSEASTTFDCAALDINWSLPPKEVGPDGAFKPVEVEVEVQVNAVRDIDIVKQTAHCVINAKLYWRDPRLVPLLQNHLLEAPGVAFQVPDSLWRPGLVCPNFRNKFFFVTDKPASKDVRVVDVESAMLMIETPYNDEMENLMEIAEFPFDEDSVDARFGGNMARDGRQTDPAEFIFVPHSANPIGLLMRDTHPEWKLVGSWHCCEVRDNGPYFFWGLVLRRRFSYFFYNVVVPQVSIVLISLCFHSIDPLTELSDRMGLTVTMYLVSVAMLYVLKDFLPRSETRTPLDKLVNLSSNLMLLSVLETTALGIFVGRRGPPYEPEDVALVWQIDMAFAALSLLVYTLWCARAFAGRCQRHLSAEYAQTWFPSTAREVQRERGQVRFCPPQHFTVGDAKLTTQRPSVVHPTSSDGLAPADSSPGLQR